MTEPSHAAATPSFGVVILTMGRRRAELSAAIDSVLRQRDVATDVVVVGNSWQPVDLPGSVRGHFLPENLGIPAGRNAGVPDVRGEFLLFLDDDASLPAEDFLAGVAARFARDPLLALIQPRVEDPTGLPAPRRWTPRLRVGDSRRSSPALALWEGAVAVRRDVFEQAGGWPDPYFYAHEGIELVWRVWDTGAVARYEGDLVACHPAIDPARHDFYYRLNARNRVWLARRNLPRVLEPIYLGTWLTITLARTRDPRARRAWWHGFREGIRVDPGGRRPLRWRTIWRMTRAGRPPII